MFREYLSNVIRINRTVWSSDYFTQWWHDCEHIQQLLRKRFNQWCFSIHSCSFWKYFRISLQTCKIWQIWLFICGKPVVVLWQICNKAANGCQKMCSSSPIVTPITKPFPSPNFSQYLHFCCNVILFSAVWRYISLLTASRYCVIFTSTISKAQVNIHLSGNEICIISHHAAGLFIFTCLFLVEWGLWIFSHSAEVDGPLRLKLSSAFGGELLQGFACELTGTKLKWHPGTCYIGDLHLSVRTFQKAICGFKQFL